MTKEEPPSPNQNQTPSCRVDSGQGDTSWAQAWEEQRTPWDVGFSAPILRELVKQGTLPKGRALVPGCGSGYDVLTLASADREVVGVDLAPKACIRFQELRAAAGVDPSRASCVVGDFFSLALDTFDLIWDYTFLCALAPRERMRWCQRMAELLKPTGILITLLFPVTKEKAPDSGPPFPLDPDALTELFRPTLHRFSLQKVATSIPSRQGKEWLAYWRKG